jgi:hypothetical protein
MQLDMYLLKQNGKWSYKKDIHLQINDTQLCNSVQICYSQATKMRKELRDLIWHFWSITQQDKQLTWFRKNKYN